MRLAIHERFIASVNIELGPSLTKKMKRFPWVDFFIPRAQNFFMSQKSNPKSPNDRRSGRKTPQKSQKLI